MICDDCGQEVIMTYPFKDEVREWQLCRRCLNDAIIRRCQLVQEKRQRIPLRGYVEKAPWDIRIEEKKLHK